MWFRLIKTGVQKAGSSTKWVKLSSNFRHQSWCFLRVSALMLHCICCSILAQCLSNLIISSLLFLSTFIFPLRHCLYLFIITFASAAATNLSWMLYVNASKKVSSLHVILRIMATVFLKNNAELIIAGMPNLAMSSLWPNLASGFSMKEATLRSVIKNCVLLAAVYHFRSHKMEYVFHFMFFICRPSMLSTTSLAKLMSPLCTGSMTIW